MQPSNSLRAAVPLPAENKEDPALERHSRKCKICSHPERDAIEEQFTHWVRPAAIARMFDLEWKSLYRYVHATGLISRRSSNMRSLLEGIMERGVEAQITADAMLRTVRAYCSCLTEDNRWVDPPTTVAFSMQRQEIPLTTPGSRAIPSGTAQILNSQPQQSPMSGCESEILIATADD